MKPERRSSRSEAPVRFEAFDEGNPHDLMSRRKQLSEQKLQTRSKRIKALKKQIYRQEKKLVESVEEKEINKWKETERKRIWRQKKKDEAIFEPLEDREKKKKKETERKQKYRKKKKADKEVGKV